MEFKYASAPVNRPVALQLSSTVRFIDDLLSSTSLPFSNVAGDIYDRSLTLEYSAQNDRRCDYLDLSINIENQRTVSVYNKTDAFNFSVLRYSYPCSNVPSDLHYQVLASQILRFVRICNNLDSLQEKVSEVVQIYISRNFSTLRILAWFCKIYARNSYAFQKVGICDRLQAVAFINRILV